MEETTEEGGRGRVVVAAGRMVSERDLRPALERMEGDLLG